MRFCSTNCTVMSSGPLEVVTINLSQSVRGFSLSNIAMVGTGLRFTGFSTDFGLAVNAGFGQGFSDFNCPCVVFISCLTGGNIFIALPVFSRPPAMFCATFFLTGDFSPPPLAAAAPGARTYYSTGQGCHLWKVFWSEDILLDRTGLPSMEGLLERGHTTRPDRAAIYGRSSGARTYYSTGQGCHLWKVFWSEDILLDRTGLPSMEGLLERGHTTRPDRAAIYGRSSGARTYYSTGQGCHLWKVFWSEDILLDRTGLPSMEGLLERGHTTRPDRAAIYGRSSGARTYYSTGQGCHLWKVFWSEDILLDRTGLPSMEGLLERGHTTRPDRAAIYGRSSGARTYYSTGQGCHLWKVFWS